jgi:stage III sporulation protein AE
VKIWIVLVLMIMLCTGVAGAEPQDGADAAARMLDSLAVEDVNRIVTQLNRELTDPLPLLDAATIKNIAAQGVTPNWSNVWERLWNYLFRELRLNYYLLGKLLFLAVLCVLLQNLQNSFEQSGISLLAYSVCFIFLAVIALTAFYNAVTLARETVDHMIGIMEALLPLLLSLLAGMGAVTSAALLTPLMLFTVSAVGILIKDLILPLLFLTAVLDCLNCFSSQYRLSNLSAVIRQTGMVCLGLVLVIFIGITSVQGVAGSVADGVTLRATKYAVTTFVPVIGKLFADTVELVMGASLLLKNAVGIFGIIAITSICIFPLLKLVALIFVIKIAGALIQPLGDERMASFLAIIGNDLWLVFSGVLVVGLMFFLAITMIVGVGTAAMMLR